MGGTSTLTLRLLSAAFLAPLCIAAVLLLDTAQLAVLFAAAAAVAAWEWSALAGLRALPGRFFYTALVTAILLPLFFAGGLQRTILLASLAWWVFAFCYVLGFGRRLGAAATLAAGVFSIAPAWLAAVAVHRAGVEGPLLLALLFGTVWLADAAAWGVGKRFGRRPLAPRLSPAKTREGALGALVLAPAAAAAAWAWLPLPLPLWAWLAVSVTCVLAAVAGDLLESAFKRAADVKDSGALIPGHGGILDRTDSFLAAAPFYAVAVRAAW